MPNRSLTASLVEPGLQEHVLEGMTVELGAGRSFALLGVIVPT
jgi:hypothetical protein